MQKMFIIKIEVINEVNMKVDFERSANTVTYFSYVNNLSLFLKVYILRFKVTLDQNSNEGNYFKSFKNRISWNKSTNKKGVTGNTL